MNKKKILVLAMTLSMVAILAIGGSIAYFTAEDNAENVFTVGNVEIDLTEPNWEAQGEAEAADAYPGEALAKDPTVTNVGANPCFVRISVEGLDCLGDAGDIIYRTNYADNTLGENWVLHTDGYFYYTKVLAAGEETTSLFDQIVIPAGVTNEDAVDEAGNVRNYNIKVTAYAVQAQGAKPSFSALETITVGELAAWFTTCGF